jgi:ribosomal protein S5
VEIPQAINAGILRAQKKALHIAAKSDATIPASCASTGNNVRLPWMPAIHVFKMEIPHDKQYIT